jgi:DNA-binding Lrp family transcriptional regulator
MLDQLDKEILKLLQNEGRISNVELSQRINLSSPAIHTRIKRMEKAGVIKQYAALLNQEMIDYEMLCFISISVQIHQARELANFKDSIIKMPEILECYNVTGEYDYLVKVVVKNRQGLQKIIEKITKIPGVSRMYTRLSIDELKSTTNLPLD